MSCVAQVYLAFFVWIGLVPWASGAAPTITVWNPTTQYVLTGEAWTEPGVDCQDPEEGYLDVTMRPTAVNTASPGSITVTYTCSDNLEWPFNTVTATRTVIVRSSPTIALSGAGSITISNGAFGPRVNSYCRETTSPYNQQTAGLVTLDAVSTAYTEERQAKCLALCRSYQRSHAQDGKGCELRVAGATSPGCYIHTNSITSDGAVTANHFCWKAEFNDPGACCADYLGTSLSVMKSSYPSTTVPGNFQIRYWCEDSLIDTQVSVTRDLAIDQPPTMTLLGDANTKVTRGAAYTDAGVICHDVEDGPLIEVPLGGYSQLKIASTTTSGFSGGVNFFASSDSLTVAGAYSGSGTPCENCHVTTADGNGLHWIRLDLGTVRTIYKVRMHKTAGTWTIKAGTSEVMTRNPTCGSTPTGTGWQDTICSALLAARYVQIQHNSEMTVCEVTLEGQAGPSAPESFEILSGCTDLHGTYTLSSTAEGRPTWSNAAASGTLLYQTTGFVLKRSSTEYSSTPEGASLVAAQWVAVTSGCVPLIKFTPEDACTWLYGFSSSNDRYKCADGTEQNNLVECVERGGLAHCPPNKPQACALLDTDPSNANGCAVDCQSYGGLRKCGENSKTGIAASIPFFLGTWAGTRNNADGDFGISFIPKTTMFLTALGRHEGGVSLTQTIRVTLWSTLTQQALATADVGPSSTQEGQYRFQALSSTVTLAADIEYRLTQQCTNGMADQWNDAIETEVNMWAGTEWRYATFVGGVSKVGSHGYPDTVDSALQRPGMVNFKYNVPAARVDKVGKVNTTNAGTVNFVFTCVDTMGQVAIGTRNIEVGCEGPNPWGIYGGNKVSCDETIATEAKADFEECTTLCLADADCEAAQFMTDTGQCSKLRKCTGMYERDHNIYRQVGICKVLDNPPTVELGAAAETVNKDGTWTPGVVICRDNEDQVPPTAQALDTLITSTPGVFTIRYSCTDTVGQTSIGSYTVTVKDTCSTSGWSDPNIHPSGPCEGLGQSPLTFAHGTYCTARCGSGWVPVTEFIHCQTTGRLDYASQFSTHLSTDGSTKSYECGEQPCTSPSVANVKNNIQGVATSCQAGTRVQNQQLCIPNCLDGYIPNVPSLFCNLGTLTPSTFICELPASMPTTIGFGVPDTQQVSMTWSAGSANDCTFHSWESEVRQTIKGFTEDAIAPGNEQWQNITGCGAHNHTSRSSRSCTAYDLLEGATYEFRVREACIKEVLNSAWKVSATVQMRIVYPPEVIFRIPNADVTFDPVQVMVAYSVAVRLTDHDYWGDRSTLEVNISRSGTWCVDSTGGFGGVDVFSVAANDIIETGSAPSYCRLTGERIIILKPLNNWLQAGCDYTITADIGILQTVDTPSKPSPWLFFNFTHIDVAPEFKQFVLVQKTTTWVKFQVYWTLITVCNCTLIPTDTANACPSNPSNQGCQRHVLGFKEQVTDDGHVEYEVPNLYPGTEYRANCDGYKFGKPWVPVVPIPSARYPELTFQTDQDTDATVSYFFLNVTVVCDPVGNPGVGVHLPQRYKQIPPAEFPIGYTVQILDWRDTCVGGRQMLHNEQARMTVTATTDANSVFAVVRWLNEPQADDVLMTTHHFDYTKDTNVNADPISFTFRFNICPLAAILQPTGPVQCTTYQIVVQCVDISFSFDYFVLDSSIDGSEYHQRRLADDDDGWVDSPEVGRVDSHEVGWVDSPDGWTDSPDSWTDSPDGWTDRPEDIKASAGYVELLVPARGSCRTSSGSEPHRFCILDVSESTCLSECNIQSNCSNYAFMDVHNAGGYCCLYGFWISRPGIGWDEDAAENNNPVAQTDSDEKYRCYAKAHTLRITPSATSITMTSTTSATETTTSTSTTTTLDYRSWTTTNPVLMGQLQGFVEPAPATSQSQDQAVLLLESIFHVVSNAHEAVQTGEADSMHSALQERFSAAAVSYSGDISDVGDASSSGRRLSAATIADHTVAVGTGAILQTNVSRATFDWTTITIHLGPIVGINGFRQFITPTGESDFNEHLSLVLTGQGTRLPVCLEWQAVTFPTPFHLSFTPPNLSVPTYEAALDVESTLVVNFGNVPNVSRLCNSSIHVWGNTNAGYGNPANYIQIGVYKEGRDENLCGTLSFPDVNDWTVAQCTLQPAALLNITVEVRLKDYLDRTFHRVNSTIVRGQVTYKLPTLTGLKDAGDWALNLDSTIEMAQVAKRPVADIFPQGDRLPSLAVVQLGGATLPGYELRIQGDAEIQMCQNLTWVNASSLQCVLHKCLNVTGLREKPGLRLYLGDLTTISAVPGTMRIPRPIIDQFLPTVIDDVGRNRTIQFWGRNFGEQSCKDTHIDSVQFLGSPSGVHITLGDYAAPCRIIFQNNTYIECQISDPVRDPRDTTYVGTGLPPPQRTSLQSMTFLKGKYLNAKNLDTVGTTVGGRLLEELEQEDQWFNRELQAATTNPYIKLELTVVLMPCPAGYRRVALNVDECEPCRKGRYNTLTSSEWPLLCHVCEEGKYSDQEGSTACKDCPANTFAAQPATSIEACLCKPGYYSQYYNESTARTRPGTPCISCSSQIMTDMPLVRKETCGGNVPVADYCTAPTHDACVPETIGVMYYRVCKAYCGGGTSWPQAKRTFYNLESRQISGPGTDQDVVQGATLTGPRLFEPQLARCDPPVACLTNNICDYRYNGLSCGECVFGYYRDKYSKECVPCGQEQVIGMVIMAGVVVMMSFGGLIGSSSFMRLKSDIVFAHELKLAAKEFIVEPLMKSKAFMAVCNGRERRVTVILNKWDVGSSYRYAKKGHLGMVFRVSVNGVIHVAGLLPQSPCADKVKVGWKLISVNGVRPRAKEELEVQQVLMKTEFPLRLVFRCPPLGSGDGTLEGLDNDRKMIVMLIGVMNAFNQISMFDFEWPPIFTQLAALAAQFSFSFNFFHPECSVPTPFNTKWMGFLAIPYCMVGPLLLAYTATRLITTPGLTGVTLTVKKWLLKNAFARTMCMSIIVLLPFHLEQLLVPFACVERAEGTYFVSATPDTLCSFKDKRYGQMLLIATCGGSVMLAFYAVLLLMLHKSFTWQFGLKARDDIPFYAGMVEVSVFGQLGYVEEVRWRVMSNTVAIHMFDPGLPLLKMRENLEFASSHLKDRSRKGVAEKMKKMRAEAKGRFNSAATDGKEDQEDEKDEDEKAEAQMIEEDEAAAARSTLKRGIRRWKKSKFSTPASIQGNVITYGWILIVNLFWRQLLSLITIKMSEGNLVVVGAAFQMLIYGGNVTMLIVFKPYKSIKVSNIESTMLSALFMVLWCAVIKDLLTNHMNAHLFADTMNKVNTAIDGMAIVLMTLVVVMPSMVVHELLMKVLNSMQGQEAILNEIYMAQSMRAEKEALAKSKREEAEELEAMIHEGGLVLPDDIARRYHGVRDAVKRINGTGQAPTPEQRRRFVHFVQIARMLPYEKAAPKARLQGMGKKIIQENNALHVLQGSDESEIHGEEEEEGLKCKKGVHLLILFPTPDDNWWCSECALTCLRGTKVHRCHRCNYHLCGKCYNNCRVGGRCENGHILVHSKTIPWASAEFCCHQCREAYGGGARWHCEKCKFDWCFRCRPEKKEGDEEQEETSTKKGILGKFFGKKRLRANTDNEGTASQEWKSTPSSIGWKSNPSSKGAKGTTPKAAAKGKTMKKQFTLSLFGKKKVEKPKDLDQLRSRVAEELGAAPLPPETETPAPPPPPPTAPAGKKWPARMETDEFDDDFGQVECNIDLDEQDDDSGPEGGSRRKANRRMDSDESADRGMDSAELEDELDELRAGRGEFDVTDWSELGPSSSDKPQPRPGPTEFEVTDWSELGPSTDKGKPSREPAEFEVNDWSELGPTNAKGPTKDKGRKTATRSSEFQVTDWSDL